MNLKLYLIAGMFLAALASGLSAQIGTGQAIAFTDGRNNPKSGNVDPGMVNVPVLQANVIVLSTAQADITAIAVGNVGNAGASDYTALKLWDDLNGNGLVDAGDVLLGTATGAFPASFTLPKPITITSAGATLLVAVDISASASVGVTFGIQLDPVNHVTVSPLMQLGYGPITGGDQTVNPIATTLSIVTQPAGAGSGSPFTSQPVLEILDQSGRVMTGYTLQVHAAIGTGPAGATLQGTASVSPVNGQAAFSDLRIDLAGAGYQLTFTSGSLSATSASFDVAHGAATQISVNLQPGGARQGDPLAPQPIVELRDAAGNLCDTDSSTVVQAVLAGGTAGALLSGATSMAAVNGVVTFTDLSVDTSGLGYQLDFSGTGLASASSSLFDITAGPTHVNPGNGDDDDGGCVAQAGGSHLWLAALSMMMFTALGVRLRRKQS